MPITSSPIDSSLQPGFIFSTCRCTSLTSPTRRIAVLLSSINSHEQNLTAYTMREIMIRWLEFQTPHPNALISDSNASLDEATPQHAMSTLAELNKNKTEVIKVLLNSNLNYPSLVWISHYSCVWLYFFIFATWIIKFDFTDNSFNIDACIFWPKY